MGDGTHRGGPGKGHGRNDHWDDCHRRPLRGVRLSPGHRSAEKTWKAVEKVEELFDYCQILEAYITRAGREFLIQVHGYEGLYKINQRSGWFPEEESLEEFKLTIQGEMEQTVWQDEA